MPQKYLVMDYETASLLDLKEVGLDNYAKHPSTRILMMAYSICESDDEVEVPLWLPHESEPPEDFMSALLDPSVLKVAWHSCFENAITRHVLSRMLGREINIPFEQWRDPIVLAHNLSLPGYLDDVGEILHFKHQKDPRGDGLKDMFCMPVSKGGEMTLFGIAPPLFRDHLSHPVEFAQFGEYCKQDVRAEKEGWFKMLRVGFPEEQWRGWFLDQKINSRGIPTRRDLAEKGYRMALRFIEERRALLKQKTGLENPNSDKQMLAWVTARGYPWKSLRGPTVQAELKKSDSPLTPEAKEILKLRASARKSSYTKIEKLLNILSEDDQLRNQFVYMGAARTGRWKSGGGEEASVQIQNLARGEKAVKKKLALALELLEKEDYDGIVAKFTNTPNPEDSVTVVEFVITLLRSLFQARPGKKMIVADKNAIENRMLGWASGCKAILDVFRTCDKCGHINSQLLSPFECEKCGGMKARCPYLSFGTYVYSQPYEQLRDEYAAGNGEKRQNAKPPVLGAGYGLGGGEMYLNEYGDEVRGGLWGYALTVCGVDMPKQLAHDSVNYFRKAYPEVPQLWEDLEQAFKQVLLRGGVIRVGEVTWTTNHTCGFEQSVVEGDHRATCKCRKEWMEHPTKGKQCVLTLRRIKMESGGYSIRLELPSGRALHYLNATVENEDRVSKKTGKPYTVQVLYYDGIEHSASQDATGQTKKKTHKWGRVKTYGGKLTENVVQAMSRDDLLNSMFLADEMGFDIWGLFHDELATEVDADSIGGLTVEDLNWCMCQVPEWAPGFILGAEGYESKYYKKG